MFKITSESVTEGHPDKVCDIISDSILDAYLALDPFSRVAVETAITDKFVVVMGEVTSNGVIDVEKIVRSTIDEIGYDSSDYEVVIKIHSQSPCIAQGVDTGGAGDQGIVYGYACDGTPELMPLSISLAHKLARQLTKVRKDGTLPYLQPDGKTQVSLDYKTVDTVLISAQHDEKISQEKIYKDIEKYVVKPLIPLFGKLLVNPTGSFVIGGPTGDTGLTGRKIIVDTYGGVAHHGGGAFSGKDPTKVDRSGAYFARFVAKNIVASGVAKKCEVQVAYAIGIAEPVSVQVTTDRLSQAEELSKLVKQAYDFRPQAIIERLNLRKPIYKQTAAYGHFGRDEFPWERVANG